LRPDDPCGNDRSVPVHDFARVSILHGPEAMTPWPAVTVEASERDVFRDTTVGETKK
jgi:hypothetical protein